MKRISAWAGLLLLATACGAGTTLSAARPGRLPAGEWCAEYRQLIGSTGLDQGPPPINGPGFLSMMQQLRDLADRAPVEIRDDLRAIWTVPDGLLDATPPLPADATPPLPADATPPDWERTIGPQLERPMRWLADNCGDQPPGADDRPAGDPPAPPEVRPAGDWQAVQRGTGWW